MKKTNKTIISLALALVLGLSMAACQDKDASSTSVQGGNEDSIEAVNEGNVSLPSELAAPETAGTMATFITEGTMYGSFLLINYRTTDYFTTGGTLTLTINASLFSLKDDVYIPQETKYQEASVALWKKGEADASFVQTAYFKADGTAYTASFEGLDTTAQYRIGITYSDVARYRMTGSFSLAGLTSEQPAASDSSESEA